MPINILIVDDHGIVRAGLRSLLTGEPDLQVIGEAVNGVDALRLAVELRPQVVLADISMPGPNGIELARELAHRLPGTAVLVLTMHDDPGLVREARKAGARGYVVKRSVEGELIQAIRSVAAGGTHYPAEPPLAGEVASAERARSFPTNLAVLLGPEDLELLRLLAKGYSDAQIAGELSIAAAVAQKRRTDLTSRLGLRGRVDTMRFARERGVL
jgi:two-component system response regulator NreC